MIIARWLLLALQNWCPLTDLALTSIWVSNHPPQNLPCERWWGCRFCCQLLDPEAGSTGLQVTSSTSIRPDLTILYIYLCVYEYMCLYICRSCMVIIICLSTHVGVRVWASLLYEYGRSCKYVCRYIFVHVTVYVFMRRHGYVYEYDCFMYVYMCTYCICMYCMTMYSAVRIPLVI